ncbi:hypothetical protein GQ472_01330 [archaeon]|nr:hypothetical protein [archaeon]
MSIMNVFKRKEEKRPDIDVMIGNLETYIHAVKMKQKNASRRSSVCRSAKEKIVKEKHEIFQHVRRLADEGNMDRAKSYLVTMQKLERHEDVLSKEEELYRQKVFEYTPIVMDIDVTRKDLLYEKALSYLSPEVRDTDLAAVISGFEKIKDYMDSDSLSEPMQMRGYMLSKENMLDAQAEIGGIDVYDEEMDRIFEDISRNPEDYSTEIQEAYNLVNTPLMAETEGHP